jgi:hypothetical protein
MLVRALAAQVEAGLASPAVRAAHRTLAARFERWCAEADADTPPTMLPPRKLVATQFGAIIASARYLEQDERERDRAG